VSSSAVAIKKLMVQNYFLHHPDSREITVVKDSRSLHCLFDNGNFTNNKDAGNVMQSKNAPHYTLFSDDAVSLVKGDLILDSITGKQFNVVEIQRDKTEGTYQAQLICVEVRA